MTRINSDLSASSASNFQTTNPSLRRFSSFKFSKPPVSCAFRDGLGFARSSTPLYVQNGERLQGVGLNFRPRDAR